ncbi:hypothetical protein CVT25_000034 [Psilocybe cyanescens]|uniref:JmjC domain-containing protein n=1 Tax=Psilocybe cyanescens TaxID=93625 RepID=A0A409VX34_PSICY|nr:hypothetical protein CVT25_000034 [Psilocybe cyanescens]
MGERRLCPKYTWKSQSHWNVSAVQKKLARDGVEECHKQGKKRPGDTGEADLAKFWKRSREDRAIRVEVGVQTMALSEYKPMLAVNQGNKWIEDLYWSWNSDPVRKIVPLLRVGSQILHDLLSLPYLIPHAADTCKGGIKLLGPPNRGITCPTTSLIIEDMTVAEGFNAVDFITRLPEEDVGLGDFMTSMYFTLSSKPWSPGRRVYGLLDVPATARGIGACGITAHPFDTDPSCVTEGGWTTVWTPPGGITHPHMDFYGPIQHMVHFHGQKLWLLWPPTTKNLEWYSRHHKQVAAESLTSQAIQDLEGLHVQYFNGSSEHAFTVAPNYIHAVMSVSDAAHCATRVWRLADFTEAQRFIEWALQWCANSSNSGVTRQETLMVLDTISQDMSWWMSLTQGKKGAAFRDVKTRLDGLVAEEKSIRRRIRGAISQETRGK